MRKSLQASAIMTFCVGFQSVIGLMEDGIMEDERQDGCIEDASESCPSPFGDSPYALSMA